MVRYVRSVKDLRSIALLRYAGSLIGKWQFFPDGQSDDMN